MAQVAKLLYYRLTIDLPVDWTTNHLPNWSKSDPRLGLLACSADWYACRHSRGSRERVEKWEDQAQRLTTEISLSVQNLVAVLCWYWIEQAPLCFVVFLLGKTSVRANNCRYHIVPNMRPCLNERPPFSAFLASLGLRPGWLGLRPGWLGLWPGWIALSGDKWMNKWMDNQSPHSTEPGVWKINLWLTKSRTDPDIEIHKVFGGSHIFDQPKTRDHELRRALVLLS